MGLLDKYIPHPDITERHETQVHAPVHMAYAAACAFDVQGIPFVRALFAMRSRMMGGTKATPPPAMPFLRWAESLGWGLLEVRPDEAVVMGAVCQPWEADVTFRPLPAEQFAQFPEGNLVKIAWTMETAALNGERSRLATETRAVATDATARARFLRYWRWARFGIIPIRWFVLPAIRRSAETEYRQGASALPR
jgi:hypothetical protein